MARSIRRWIITFFGDAPYRIRIRRAKVLADMPHIRASSCVFGSRAPAGGSYWEIGRNDSAAMFQVGASAIMDLLWAGETLAGVRVYPLHAFRAAFACCVVAAIVSVVMSLRLRDRGPVGGT